MKRFIFCFAYLVFYFNFTFGADSIYVAKYKNDKICAISYTFDDGLKDQYTILFPILEKYGFKATFWIWGLCIDNKSADLGKPRMSWKEIKELAKEGHEISNHSWSHKNMRKITLEEAKVEIEKNDSAIFANTGIMPRTFCYPNNVKPSSVVKLASKGRVGTRLTQTRVGGKITAEQLEQWVNSLLTSGEWEVTMTHGIKRGYDAFKKPDVLWNHFEKVKALEEKIWVGTFREIAAYTNEQKHVRLDIRQQKKGYTITPQLDLDKEIFTEPLTMVIKQKEIRKISVRQGKKKLSVRQNGDKFIFDFDPHGKTIRIAFFCRK